MLANIKGETQVADEIDIEYNDQSFIHYVREVLVCIYTTLLDARVSLTTDDLPNP